MLRLADVLRRHGPDYLRRYGQAVLPSHARAVQAILACRTAALGGHLAECSQCGHTHLLYHSCRHRACPQCGYDATTRWLAHQEELLLPVAYFHVVFTLPAELRHIVRSNQRVLLRVLFQAAFQSLSALCADPHWLGGRIGALAVLHTWTRTLEYHPHIHMLVPAGALAPDGCTWLLPKTRRKSFLVPARALAQHFRGRFLHLARRALPQVTFPEIPWGKRWVVFAKPSVQGPQRILQYLGRYVHRTALSDKAIVACDDQTVTFGYRDSRDHQKKTMTLPAHEFLRRFLQHVPAKGLHRVRAFGLLHPAHGLTWKRLQLLLASPVAKAPPNAPIFRAHARPEALLHAVAPTTTPPRTWSHRAKDSNLSLPLSEVPGCRG
jgi:ribosomal protein L32